MQRFRVFVLPQSLIVAAYLFLSSLAGQALGSMLFRTERPAGVLAQILYFFVVALLLSVVSMLPLDGNLLFSLASIDACASLVLCPLFLNIETLLSGAGVLRVLSVPYLLYFIRDILA